MEIVNVLCLNDNVSRKYIQKTVDGYRIETLYVNYKNKHIICFSTQVGCNLGCKFCYNGLKHNYKRNLTCSEICQQVENVLIAENLKNDKPILFSAMGIGEPLLNYDNLVCSFYYLDKKYPKNRFALATTGINLNNILRLSEDLKNIKFKLTISLHSANQKTRNNLIPACNSIYSLVETVKEYEQNSNQEVEWNYVLFGGINDTMEDAKDLYELLGENQYIKINRFNQVEISGLKESSNTKEFIEKLQENGMQVEYYETNGTDINGACGQMISDDFEKSLSRKKVSH